MLKTSHPQADAERIEILQGLLELRRDGHFEAIWASDNQLRVQYEVDGPLHFLSWRRAKVMVQTAREATAALALAEIGHERKPPATEGVGRARRAKAGYSGKTR